MAIVVATCSISFYAYFYDKNGAPDKPCGGLCRC